MRETIHQDTIMDYTLLLAVASVIGFLWVQ